MIDYRAAPLLKLLCKLNLTGLKTHKVSMAAAAMLGIRTPPPPRSIVLPVVDTSFTYLVVVPLKEKE